MRVMSCDSSDHLQIQSCEESPNKGSQLQKGAPDPASQSRPTASQRRENVLALLRAIGHPKWFSAGGDVARRPRLDRSAVRKTIN